MKKHALIAFLLLLSVSLSAQGRFRKPLKSQTQEIILALSDYTVGLKIGCPWSYMPDSKFTDVIHSGNFGYTFGLAIERYLQSFSVGIEGLFSQKGAKMYYDMSYQQNLTTNSFFHREMLIGYNLVSARVPVTYYFKGIFKGNKLMPYMFIAPQIDIPLGFNATLRQGKFLFETPLKQHTITQYGSYSNTSTKDILKGALVNANALAGIGFMTTIRTENSAIIIKFDVAFNYGLRNLAEDGFIWKWDKDNKKLVRKKNERIIRSHDVEANVTLIIPIKKTLRDAGYYFEDHRLFHF